MNASVLFSPHKIISLWDMIRASIEKYARMEFAVELYLRQFGEKSLPMDGKAPASEEDKKRLVARLDEDVRPGCEFFRLEHCLRLVGQIKDAAETQFVNFRYGEIQSQLRTLLHTMQSEVAERAFAFIPPNKVEFFEQEKLFGNQVYDNFKDARDDIKNAGNCLAADLHDAAVFHLMLVANHGLLRLAKEVGVEPKKKPLEYEEWHTLIESTEKKIDEKLNLVVNTSPGQNKDKDLEFYRGLLIDLRYIKDVHRNPIAHARGNYDQPKAMAALSDVRRFMQRLAERI